MIAIDVPRDIQIERVMIRDHIDKESALKILATQLKNDERIARADLVIENAGNIAEMNAKVLKLHKNILASL